MSRDRSSSDAGSSQWGLWVSLSLVAALILVVAAFRIWILPRLEHTWADRGLPSPLWMRSLVVGIAFLWNYGWIALVALPAAYVIQRSAPSSPRKP